MHEDETYKVLSIEREFEAMTPNAKIDLILRYKADPSHIYEGTPRQKEILQHIFSNDYPVHNISYRKGADLLNITLFIMESKGLIYGDNEYYLTHQIPKATPKGLIINQKGGWLKYIERVKIEKELTIKNIKASYTTSIFTRVNIVVTFFVLIISGCLSCNNSYERNINSKRIDSLRQALEVLRIDLNKQSM